ncbi:arginine/serine-rich coiled-coil protein 2 isoform X1 [Microplitis demolitor]|uniref:arginine/serine-rich coiled-coil protein 2 isoform X1 n=1 Tax=Microplitis demolitor TaxID=69319 RepID=UPI0004CCF2FE|nr:arginine/serine-rich coiled-coil protein 2 isoform X1 [Microplitis demolitor]XP_008545033.1 arginine/serine-rich coiled-coil protein 2 isoform X1 [Microplitis demolitor]
MESRRYDRGRICDSPPEPPSPPSYSTQSRISCELSTQRSYKANSRQSPSYTEYSNKHNTVRSAQEVGTTTSSSSSSSHDKRRKRHKRSREGSSDGSRKYSRRRRSKSRSRSRGVRSKSRGARSRSRGNRSRSPAVRSRSRGVRSRSRGGRSKSRERYRNNSYSRSYSRSPSQHSRGYSRSHSRSRSRSRSNGHTSRPRDSGRDSKYRDSRSRHYRTSSHESDYIPDIIDQQLGMPPTQITQPVIPIQSNAFKNDGSFMEMFKKMQEKMQPSAEQSATSVLEDKPVVPPPLMVGKRRGGRILKTGMVAKAKTEQVVEQPKDAWSLYMAEVKKYREVCCQEEDNTRPLVK